MAVVRVKVFLTALFIMSISSAAYAKVVPVVNYENVPIVGQGGKILSLDEIGKVVQAAAERRNWKISDARPGEATATLVVRGRHSMSVKITYTEKMLAIKYKDSINMNYDPAYKPSGEYSERNEVGAPNYNPVKTASTPTVQEAIHPNYNVWVDQLLKAIQEEVMRQ